jgi:hypothetical protein
MDYTKEQLNDSFEIELHLACSLQLKESICANHYYKRTLDELWDGESYGDYYHEIRASHTKSGNPFVINI